MQPTHCCQRRALHLHLHSAQRLLPLRRGLLPYIHLQTRESESALLATWTACPFGSCPRTTEPPPPAATWSPRSPRRAAATPPGASASSHSSSERQRPTVRATAIEEPRASGSEPLAASASLSNSDDTRTLAECRPLSLSPSPPPSPPPPLPPLTRRALKKASTASVALRRCGAAFPRVLMGPHTCRACSQSTVSVLRGRLTQPPRGPGRRSASSPRRPPSEKSSEQLTVTGKDASPAAARGSDASNVSPGGRLWSGKEALEEELRVPAPGGRDRGSTATLSVQPRSKT
ncbi:hypothetical protein EYF80_051234 [Liparis tanakae]|uniref:Uncharacterized protein n=1 Tax=Liparis tanakae TaxID=230148 RepID=A0A4Z2FCD1_9TELE|nr:hypothetical protein EYF80_051234 [Liparis tanakae]